MELNEEYGDQSPVIRPKEEIRVKFSVPSPNVNESIVSTLFRLREIHTEKIGSD